MIRVFLLLFVGIGDASDTACATKQDEPASLMQALMKHNKATLSKKNDKPKSVEHPTFAVGLPGLGHARAHGVVPPSPPDAVLMQDALVLAPTFPPLTIQPDERKRLGLLQCGSLVSEFNVTDECAECGCYVRAPSGCPNHPSETESMYYWMRDEWGEEHTGSRAHREACEQLSRVYYNVYCGVDDIEAHFVEYKDGDPQECQPSNNNDPPPGCYVRTPNGCPNYQDSVYNASWTLDLWGQENTMSFECEKACKVCRKMDIDLFCGVNDTETLWIPDPAEEEDCSPPPKPGCWIRQPGGCPEYEEEGLGDDACWVRDQMGEKIEEDAACIYSEACVTIRRQRWDQVCGTSNVEAHHVPCDVTIEPLPTEPGCYVRMPAGCHCECYNETTSEGIIHNGWKWVKDEFGEQHASAGYYEAACTVNRYNAWNEYCSARDELSWENPDERGIMLFIPPPDLGEDPQPPNPGCYIRALDGCPHDENIKTAAIHWIELQQHVCATALPGSNCNTNETDCFALKPIYEEYCQSCNRFGWNDCDPSFSINFTYVERTL